MESHGRIFPNQSHVSIRGLGHNRTQGPEGPLTDPGPLPHTTPTRPNHPDTASTRKGQESADQNLRRGRQDSKKQRERDFLHEGSKGSEEERHVFGVFSGFSFASWRLCVITSLLFRFGSSFPWPPFCSKTLAVLTGTDCSQQRSQEKTWRTEAERVNGRGLLFLCVARVPS